MFMKISHDVIHCEEDCIFKHKVLYSIKVSGTSSLDIWCCLLKNGTLTRTEVYHTASLGVFYSVITWAATPHHQPHLCWGKYHRSCGGPHCRPHKSYYIFHSGGTPPKTKSVLHDNRVVGRVVIPLSCLLMPRANIIFILLYYLDLFVVLCCNAATY